MLEDDVWIGACGRWYGGGWGQGAVGLLVCLDDLLLAGRVAEGHGDSHAEGCLGLVNGAEGALLVHLACSALGLHVLSAPLLVAGEGGDGEGGAGGSGSRIGSGSLFGGVGQRQGCGGGPPVGEGASGAARGVGAERGTAGAPQLRAEIRDRGGDAVSARLPALLWRRGHSGGGVGLAGGRRRGCGPVWPAAAIVGGRDR